MPCESSFENDHHDSGSDFQFENEDFNSTDSEFDIREKKKLCKKRDFLKRYV